MTRGVGAAAILIVLVVSLAQPARAQFDQDSSAVTQCFPWQELRDGRCVAKSTSVPQPRPSPLAADPCAGAPRNLSGQCPCPASTHLETATGTCVADAPSPIRIVCDGGRLTDGQCVCPSGFDLMANGSATNGGMCVKRHTANCLGGALTVSGACLCIGQVVMDGATYDLELVNGKCLPRRCPVQTTLRGGHCVANSATASAPEPVTKTKAASPSQAEVPAADEGERPPRCPHGLVHTHAGCVPARRRPSAQIGGVPFELKRYYRNYQLPGLSNAAQGN